MLRPRQWFPEISVDGSRRSPGRPAGIRGVPATLPGWGRGTESGDRESTAGRRSGSRVGEVVRRYLPPTPTVPTVPVQPAGAFGRAPASFGEVIKMLHPSI